MALRDFFFYQRIGHFSSLIFDGRHAYPNSCNGPRHEVRIADKLECRFSDFVAHRKHPRSAEKQTPCSRFRSEPATRLILRVELKPSSMPATSVGRRACLQLARQKLPS